MSKRFDEAAKTWDKNDLVTQLSENIGRTLLKEVTLTSDMKIMDFGAGTGLLTAHIAPRVASVAAVDLSQGMLDQLKAKTHLNDKVLTYCQNIVHDPLGNDFDAIVSAMALHHVEDTDEILSVFYKHLKPTGFIAIADLDSEDGSFHNPENMQGVFHLGFKRETLQEKLINCGFKSVKFVTAHTVIKNDKSYPIFLCIAKK